MKSGIIRIVLAAATIGTLSTTALPQPAVADTTSTALLAGAAALIVGTLIYDSNKHQYYYVRGNRHVYVDNNTASYYRNHNGRYRGPEGNMHGSRYQDTRQNNNRKGGGGGH
jgi:hypothetical protein